MGKLSKLRDDVNKIMGNREEIPEDLNGDKLDYEDELKRGLKGSQRLTEATVGKAVSNIKKAVDTAKNVANAAKNTAKSTSEGTAEGAAEGTAESVAEGASEGLAEGASEGLAEGASEGLAEGTAEGVAEGTSEGVAEGASEGLAEGMSEGLAEGASEGLAEAGVGESALASELGTESALASEGALGAESALASEGAMAAGESTAVAGEAVLASEGAMAAGESAAVASEMIASESAAIATESAMVAETAAAEAAATAEAVAATEAVVAETAAATSGIAATASAMATTVTTVATSIISLAPILLPAILIAAAAFIAIFFIATSTSTGNEVKKKLTDAKISNFDDITEIYDALNKGTFEGDWGNLNNEEMFAIFELLKEYDANVKKTCEITHNHAKYSDNHQGGEWQIEDDDTLENDVHTWSVATIENEVDLDTNSNKFGLSWQEVLALCIYTATVKHENWSYEANTTTASFISDTDIKDCFSVFAYNFQYYWNVKTASEGGLISYEWDNMSQFAWKFHDFSDYCCENSLSEQESGYYYACKEPVSAPLSWSNMYEECTYLVTDVSDDVLRKDNEDLLKEVYGEELYNSDETLEDLGGIITGRTIHKTPHKFVNEIERISGTTFRWEAYIYILESLPGTEDEIKEIKELQALYESTVDDNDAKLTITEEGDFPGYHTCIGNENGSFSFDNNAIGVGYDFYMFVDKRTDKNVTANAYFYFPAGSMSMQAVNKDAYDYSYSEILAYVKAHSGYNGPAFVGHEEAIAKGLYITNQVYGFDPCYIMSQAMSEQPCLRNAEAHGKNVNYYNSATDTYNLNTFCGSSVWDYNYYGYGASDYHDCDYARSSMYIKTSSSVWKSSAAGHEREAFCGYNAKDYINKYGTTSLINATKDMNKTEVAKYLIDNKYVNCARQWCFRGLILGQDGWKDQMVSDFKEYVDPSYTEDSITEEDLRAYSIVYYASTMTSSKYDRTSTPFNMNWSGISLTTKEITDEDGNVTNISAVMYQTREEVESYAKSYGHTQSDNIKGSYTPWWAGSTGTKPSEIASSEQINSSAGQEAFAGDNNEIRIVVNHKTASIVNGWLKERQILSQFASVKDITSGDEEEGDEENNETSSDAGDNSETSTQSDSGDN